MRPLREPIQPAEAPPHYSAVVPVYPNPPRWREPKIGDESTSNPTIMSRSGSLPLYYQYLLLHSLDTNYLPIDPRNWTKRQVHQWLKEICFDNDIWPSVDQRRFPFNGKALILLSMEMLVSRAPHCGKLLYKDLRLRLSKCVQDHS